MTNEEAIARQAIFHLQNTYNAKGDHGKFAEMMQVFSPDVTFQAGDTIVHGAAQVEAFMRGALESGLLRPGTKSYTRHNLTTRQVEFDGPDSATGILLFIVTKDGQIAQTGVYFDKYGVVDGEWKITARRVKVEFEGLS